MDPDPALELDKAIGLLTRPSKHRVLDSFGGMTWITADPLLVQLALAVASSSAAPAFKASTAAGIPMDAVAHDLLARIKDEVESYWWETHRLHHGHGAGSRIVPKLRTWAAVVRSDPEALAEAATVTAGWVREIEGLFKPLRKWEVRGWCPECRARRVIDHDEDGGRISKPALEITFDAEGDIDGARCNGCGKRWPRGDVESLARFIENQPDEPDDVVSRETEESV